MSTNTKRKSQVQKRKRESNVGNETTLRHVRRMTL